MNDRSTWTPEDWAVFDRIIARPQSKEDATTEPDYRIALRPYDLEGGKSQQPSDWADDGTEPVSPPLDDIVVNDVAMFRMEDMGGHFWMCCYLDDGPRYDRIGFTVRPGRRNKGEPRIVVEACEYPEGDVEYER